MTNTFYCFIAIGKNNLGAGQTVIIGNDAQVPAILKERYPAARDYSTRIIQQDSWQYPAFGPLSPDGSNIDWNSLWNAAHAYLVATESIPSELAASALQKTAQNKIGTFVYTSGKVTFGVPVEGHEASAKRDAEPVDNDKYLNTPASITVIQDPFLGGSHIPMVVFLNDVQVASLKSGDSATIPLTLKHNVLRTNATGLFGPVKGYSFDVKDGARGVIHIGQGKFKVKDVTWSY